SKWECRCLPVKNYIAAGIKDVAVWLDDQQTFSPSCFRALSVVPSPIGIHSKVYDLSTESCGFQAKGGEIAFKSELANRGDVLILPNAGDFDLICSVSSVAINVRKDGQSDLGRGYYTVLGRMGGGAYDDLSLVLKFIMTR
ncbi:MAG: hypothetical protein AAGJ93_18155, partial [Bacteroidota bacterium]